MTRALAIDVAAGDPTGLAGSLAELANDWRVAGRMDEAMPTCLAASELLVLTANELYKILIGINLGGAYFEREE